jgi:very-short-patch-repair endonuclease
MRARKSVNVARLVLLDQYAHRNRQQLTPSEARLWSALSGRKLGVQFRRQFVIDGRFIVDFCAPKARLVVEVDGSWHDKRAVADARRDRELRRLGYRVVRVTAGAVMRDIGSAVERVRALL